MGKNVIFEDFPFRGTDHIDGFLGRSPCCAAIQDNAAAVTLMSSLSMARWLSGSCCLHFITSSASSFMLEASWNVMAHAQKPDFVFRWNGRVYLNWRGRQFSRALAAEVCASAVVMLDTPCSEVVWRVLATHSICQFPLHFPSRASPCAITFELESTTWSVVSTDSDLLTLRAQVQLYITLDSDVTKTLGLHMLCAYDSQNKHHDFHNY